MDSEDLATRLDEHVQLTDERLTELLVEMRRRDTWLINSIWGVITAVYAFTTYIGIAVICIAKDWTAWWQVLVAVAVAWIFRVITLRDHRRLRADDIARIERDSALSWRLWG